MADDIVTRLRAAARTGDLPLGVSFDCDAVADEIERLRAAGDQLAYHVRAENAKEMYTAVRMWEEARRG